MLKVVKVLLKFLTEKKRDFSVTGLEGSSIVKTAINFINIFQMFMLYLQFFVIHLRVYVPIIYLL